MYVSVRDNNVDQALRILKKKMQREGVFREMKKESTKSSSLSSDLGFKRSALVHNIVSKVPEKPLPL